MTYNGKCPKCEKELGDNEFGPKCDYCTGHEDGMAELSVKVCNYLKKRAKMFNQESKDCHAQAELLKADDWTKQILDELDAEL